MPSTTTDDRREALEHLLDGLSALGRSMRARARARQIGPDALSGGDVAVLGFLATQGPHRAGLIASRLQVGAPVMSRHLAALEDDGLVRREPDPADARAELVSVTEEGRTRLRRVKAEVCSALSSRFAEWDTAELDRVAHGLDGLAEALAVSS